MARAAAAWFKTSARDLPWRRTRDPYAILVSEFMLQQTTVQAVIPCFERWLREFPDFPSLAAADEEAVLRLWEGLGYYSRARSLLRLARVVVTEHNGCLPNDPALLRKLPGIGPYTCGAVASFAFDLPSPAIDANVGRVLVRLFNYGKRADTAEGRRAIERFNHRLLRAADAVGIGPGELNAALMEIGALICRTGEPDCLICPLRKHCLARNPARLPVKRARPAVESREDHRAWIERDGSVLLELSGGPRWRGLWLLPPCEPSKYEPLYRAVYPITRYKMTLSIWRLTKTAVSKRGKGGRETRWVPLDEVGRLPMPSPYRKAAQTIISAAKEKTRHESERRSSRRSACH